MTPCERGWGKYALEIARTREEAEQRFAFWQERANAIPGAEVRVLTLADPLGGATFVLCTETEELMPLEEREA